MSYKTKLNLKPYEPLNLAKPTKKAVQPSASYDYVDSFEVINTLERTVLEKSEDFPDEEYANDIAKAFINNREVLKELMDETMDGVTVNHLVTSSLGQGFLVGLLYALLQTKAYTQLEEQEYESEE